MVISEKDIAVDMGTCETLVYEQGSGIVVREPTVIAVDKFSGKMLKMGNEAEKMLGRTPANIVPVNPIQEGVISDYDLAALMLRELISGVTSFSFFKPCMLMCVPSSITGVQERAVIDAAIEAGARKVYLQEMAVATAVGAGIDLSKPDGHLIVDIGGGTTEVAMVSGGGVVACESIKTAGGTFDDSIVKFIRSKYNLLIGTRTAEDLKKGIGCVVQRKDMSIEEVRGRDLATGLPKSVKITSNELIDAFVDPVNAILDSIHRVLEITPPDLVGDLDANGILLSGGGSLIYGIEKVVERSTGIRTAVVDDPISCTAYGAGKLLSALDEMQDGMMNFSRRRMLRG